jgi:hypothetical protein
MYLLNVANEYTALAKMGVRNGYTVAGDPGFEPGLTDPESAVLPLDESPTREDYNKGQYLWQPYAFISCVPFSTINK